MCIAIYKPKNTTIAKETLAQCFKANPDGAGFLVAKDKELTLLKGFFTFDDFWEVYEPYAEEQCVIHFRIKTHGDVNYTNCHPFMINKSLGFIHNGIISKFGIEKLSDTNHFNEMILKPLVNRYGNSILFHPATKHLIEERIGYSKLVFLDRHGNFHIFNEDKGVWDGDVWYSNTSYKPPVVYTPKPQNVVALPKPKPKYRPVQEDDLVELLTGVYEPFSKYYFKAHTIMQVVTVNADYTCDLMAAIPDGSGAYNFAYGVSFAKFDFLADAPPSKVSEQESCEIDQTPYAYKH